MGVFKLGKMTFGSLFKKPETVLYPIQTKPQPAGLKGHIKLMPEDCILCGMCDRSCTTNCITVDKAAKTWAIDRFQCVQCGYCITVCPKKCLSMDPNYAPASTKRQSDVVDVPVADKPKSQKPKAQSAKTSSPAGEKPAKGPKAASAETQSGKGQGIPNANAAIDATDAELESKISLMGEDKAMRVREAMAARSKG